MSCHRFAVIGVVLLQFQSVRLSAGEIDAAQREAIAEAECVATEVEIGLAPDYALRIEYRADTIDDAFFDLLPRLPNLRALKIRPFNRNKEQGLNGDVIARLDGCPQLEELTLECYRLNEGDLDSLEKLPRLRSLSLRIHHGEPMPQISLAAARSTFQSLESLSVSTVDFTDDDCAWIANLPELRDVTVGGKNVTNSGVAALAKNTRLRSLKLYGEQITEECVRSLAALRELESFEFQGLGDAGLQTLAGLTKLKHLHLQNNDLTADGLQALAGLFDLEEIDLSSCGIGGGLRHLTKLKQLKTLDVSDCGLTDDDLVYLRELPNLESLRIGGNADLTHKGALHLAELTNLRHLNLGNFVDLRNGLDDFARLTKLKSISVSSEAIELKAIQGFPEIESLLLSGVVIGKDGLDSLKSLKSLKKLHLSDADLNDADLSGLSGLVNLESLSLGVNNNLTDAGIRHLASLTNLRFLNLGSEQFTDDCCAHLEQMSKLRRLYLVGSGFTDKGLASLGRLHSLQTLSLGGPTELNENGVASLQKLAYMTRLTIQLSEQSDVPARDLAEALPDVLIGANGTRYNNR